MATDEVVYQLEEGKLEGVYSDEMFFQIWCSPSMVSGSTWPLSPVRKYTSWIRIRKEVKLKKTSMGERISIRAGRTQKYLSSNRNNEAGLIDCPWPSMEGVAYGVYDVQLENSQLSWKE